MQNGLHKNCVNAKLTVSFEISRYHFPLYNENPRFTGERVASTRDRLNVAPSEIIREFLAAFFYLSTFC